MAPDTPRLAPAARLVNTVGRPLRRRIALDPSSLFAAAAEQVPAGSTAEIKGPLQRLVDALERQADLSLIGRVAARRYLIESIRNRWHIDRWHAATTDDEPLPAPLIVVGLPRTGTTFLHRLLALAPGCRTPLGWEAARPVPTDVSAARAEVEQQFGRLHRMAPALARMHPIGADVPQECVALMAYDIMSPQYHFTWRVPDYADWLTEQPMAPVYRRYRQALRCLMRQRPGAQLVLKSPCHLPTLDALRAAFPNAGIVHTVRDPLAAIPSGASLVWHLRSTFSDAADPTEIGRDYLDRWTDAADRAVDAHRGPAGARWIDVPYADLVADPVGAVDRIHRHFDRPFTREHLAALRRFLDVDRAVDRRHRYTLGTFGLDRAAVADRFAAYLDHFAPPAGDA